MSIDNKLETELVRGVVGNLSRYLGVIPITDEMNHDAYEFLGVLSRQVDALTRGLTAMEQSNEKPQEPKRRCRGCRKTRVEGPRAPDGHSVVSKWATYPAPTVLEVDDDLRRLIPRVDRLENAVKLLADAMQRQRVAIDSLIEVWSKG